MNADAIQQRVQEEVNIHFEYYKNVLHPSDHILDIGIGTGVTANYIQSQLPQATLMGLDIHNMLKVELPITVYEGGTIPFSDHSYDVSLLFYVLHHVPKSIELLREANRVTRRTILVIEEFELSESDHHHNMEKENEVLRALGISKELFHQDIEQQVLETWFTQCNLALLEKIPLPTKSEKKIGKYLYILRVSTE